MGSGVLFSHIGMPLRLLGNRVRRLCEHGCDSCANSTRGIDLLAADSIVHSKLELKRLMLKMKLNCTIINYFGTEAALSRSFSFCLHFSLMQIDICDCQMILPPFSFPLK